MNPTSQHTNGRDGLQRLQIAAALVLGAILLAAILLRAYLGNVLPAGWWKP